MSTINLNDSTPAAPGKLINSKIQSDASGNVSVYHPGGTWDETFVPTVTPLPPMTLPMLSSIICSYARNGSLGTVSCTVVGILGGTASNRIDVSLPPVMPMVGNRSFTSAAFIQQATQQAGLATISYNFPTIIQVTLPGLVSYTANNFSFLFTVNYRVA